MTPEGGRTWGYWTQLKLAILRDYLTQFVVASQAQSERIYLDAFAGEGHGRDRLTGAEFRGSASIALDVGGGTGFTRFRYFELGPKASELESALRADYPDGDIKVHPGDCNDSIPQALAELKQLSFRPANRSRAAISSSATRLQIEPTVRHVTRINSATAFFDVLTASQQH